MQHLVFHIANPRSMNLSDPGTGKTPVAALYTYWCIDRHDGFVVWIQPTSIIRKNREEILRFVDLKPEDVKIAEGTPAQRQAVYASRPRVLMITADTFGREWQDILRHMKVTLVVTDENHLIYAGSESKRTSALYEAMKRIERYLPMTGTAIDGKYSTIYPALHIIEPRYYFSYKTFVAEHAVVDAFGRVIAWHRADRLREIIKRHSVRTTFEEAYGKEAKVFLYHRIEMTKEQQRVYDELEEKALIELDDRFIDAALPGVHAIRARQVLGCPEDLGLKFKPARDEFLMQKLEEAPKFTVFSCFVSEIERIGDLCKKAGFKVGIMHGGVPPKKRAEIDEQFRAGLLDGVVASWEVAGQSYNWHHLTDVFCASMNYKDGGFLQAYRRGIRGVRSSALRIHLLTYRAKIDYRILRVMERKSREANAVDPSVEVLNLMGPVE